MKTMKITVLATKICVLLAICLLGGACAIQTVQPPPDDPSILYQEALLQQNRGDPEGAYKKLIHIWQNYPQNSIAPQALFSAASIVETTNPTKAIELYKTLRKQYPQSDSAHKTQERLFINYLSNKRYTEAINLFTRIYPTTTDPAWRMHGVKLVQSLAEANRISESFDIIEALYPSADDQARTQRLSLWDFVVDKIEQLEVLSQLKTKVNDPDLLEILDAKEELLADEQASTQGREPFRPLPRPSLASEDGLYSVNRIGVVVPLSGKW
ncbi:MAG: tetratricopeptide repeat protein, partial [Deltaproteobacteria bacterium]|nr:tetratricopeptide repeat protein [Deltaproteobacteria bacterium]